MIKSKYQRLYRFIILLWFIVYALHLPGWSLFPMTLFSYFSDYNFYHDGQRMLFSTKYHNHANAFVEYMVFVFGYFILCGVVLFALLARRLLVFLKLLSKKELEPLKFFIMMAILYLAFSYFILSGEHSNFWNPDRRFNQNPYWLTTLFIGVLWPMLTTAAIASLLEPDAVNKLWKTIRPAKKE